MTWPQCSATPLATVFFAPLAPPLRLSYPGSERPQQGALRRSGNSPAHFPPERVVHQAPAALGHTAPRGLWPTVYALGRRRRAGMLPEHRLRVPVQGQRLPRPQDSGSALGRRHVEEGDPRPPPAPGSSGHRCASRRQTRADGRDGEGLCGHHCGPAPTSVVCRGSKNSLRARL